MLRLLECMTLFTVLLMYHLTVGIYCNELFMSYNSVVRKEGVCWRVWWCQYTQPNSFLGPEYTESILYCPELKEERSNATAWGLK